MAQTRDDFIKAAANHDVVPVTRCVLGDHLTPVLAYRRLVREDARGDTSFLLESVETGGVIGRYSILAAQPDREITARRDQVCMVDHASGATETCTSSDPLDLIRTQMGRVRVAPIDIPELAHVFLGGWAGWFSYDTVRWLEPKAMVESQSPPDDRSLPDLHLGCYQNVVVFDHLAKTLLVTCWANVSESTAEAAWSDANASIDQVLSRLDQTDVTLASTQMPIDAPIPSGLPGTAVTSREDFERGVRQCIEYIKAGDIFQVVPSQRFERESAVDPFDVYRALRVVNPSPYMIYMQSPEVVLVASSPEILCKVRGRTVTSRPLAGTRRRGVDHEEDQALEASLRADAKELAEHAMLVDLARNDLGRVCQAGTVEVDRLKDVERYSHVMHLSSTVTGTLEEGKDCWDALRQALPVGTVSGAPKIRAMQIIDALEPVRRGPYAGGIGCVSFGGDMDVAIALRTIVVPSPGTGPPWSYHLQAGAGVVLDSIPEREYQETIDKAAALGCAIDVAEASAQHQHKS